MDPTDYQVRNVAHDWEEHEKREGRYYRADPSQVKVVSLGFFPNIKC